MWAGRREAMSGVRVSETMQEATTASVTVAAKALNTRPTTPPISRIGRKTATSDRVIERTVKPISLAPRIAAGIGAMPSSMCRTMALQHHDGIVHHQADRDGQAQQGHVVDAVAQRVHQAEGDQRLIGTAMVGISVALIRRRNRKQTSTTRPMAIAKLSCTSCTAGADRLGPVEEDLELGARRQRGAQPLEAGPDAVHHVDRIGVRLPQHRQHQGAVLVPPGGDAGIGDAVGDAGDLAQPDRRLRLAGDDQVAEGRGVLRLVVGAQRQLLPLAVQARRPGGGIGLGDGLQRGVEGQAHGGDAVGVEPHPHGIELLAKDLHLRHADDA